jgi:hypothetical protein
MREELSEAEFRLPIQLNAKIERKQGVLPDETVRVGVLCPLIFKFLKFLLAAHQTSSPRLKITSSQAR